MLVSHWSRSDSPSKESPLLARTKGDLLQYVKCPKTRGDTFHTEATSDNFSSSRRCTVLPPWGHAAWEMVTASQRPRRDITQHIPQHTTSAKHDRPRVLTCVSHSGADCGAVNRRVSYVSPKCPQKGFQYWEGESHTIPGGHA